MSVDFLDSNMFIYQFSSADARKRAIADRLVRDAIETGRGCISHQVIQECLNVLGSKAARPLPPADLRLYLDEVLLPLYRIAASAALYRRALDIQARWRFGFYDALVVAGALEGGCERLYTEDLQHGQRIGTLIVENPFRG
jgi:predicted nucleic acid-binding protein